MREADCTASTALVCQLCEGYLAAAGYTVTFPPQAKPQTGECSICHERTTCRAARIERRRKGRAHG